jgi:hypothetical protein
MWMGFARRGYTSLKAFQSEETDLRGAKPMLEMRRVKHCAVAVTAIFILLGTRAAIAQAGGSSAMLPKPDLHAGGASPSTIPNHAVTVVTLPGFHLTGARIITEKTCKVVSYQVVSDNEIKMNIEGTRTVDDKDDTCTLEVRTPAGSASTWIVVELTDVEQEQVKQRERAEGEAKAQAFIAKSGKVWRLTFAGGATETYSSVGANDDAMPTFHNAAGDEVKIAVSNDNTVMIIESGCMRSGKLAGSQVKDGQSQGECTPSGTWTATVTYKGKSQLPSKIVENQSTGGESLFRGPAPNRAYGRGAFGPLGRQDCSHLVSVRGWPKHSGSEHFVRSGSTGAGMRLAKPAMRNELAVERLNLAI